MDGGGTNTRNRAMQATAQQPLRFSDLHEARQDRIDNGFADLNALDMIRELGEPGEFDVRAWERKVREYRNEHTRKYQ